MGRFLTRARASLTDRSGASACLPPRWQAVGEALVPDPAGRRPDTLRACALVGQALAGDGEPLEEALDALRSTSRLVTGQEPAYDVVKALATGWSEATLGYLSDVTCEDPLTGLASLPHLRSRISELYRDQAAGQGTVRDRYVLVLLDTPRLPAGAGTFEAALRTARLAETARTVFSSGSTAGRVGRERVAVMVRRDGRLPRRLALVRALLAGVTPPVRVWVETMPLENAAATTLLDDLARC